MAERRWSDNVEYYEYAPTAVVYDSEHDDFTVARADLHTADRRHRASLYVVVTVRELSAQRLTLDTAVARGRVVLERLIEQYRGVADTLVANVSRTFDLDGHRVR